MRLTKEEVKIIKECFYKNFQDGKIYLFGSRVDDKKRGGDIDLYVIPKTQDQLVKKKIEFLVDIKRKLGKQKIDLIISRDKNSAIEKQALSSGIEL